MRKAMMSLASGLALSVVLGGGNMVLAGVAARRSASPFPFKVVPGHLAPAQSMASFASFRIPEGSDVQVFYDAGRPSYGSLALLAKREGEKGWLVFDGAVTSKTKGVYWVDPTAKDRVTALTVRQLKRVQANLVRYQHENPGKPGLRKFGFMLKRVTDELNRTSRSPKRR